MQTYTNYTLYAVGFLFTLFLILFELIFISAPHTFPLYAQFEIEKGDTLSDTAERLKSENLITSTLLFKSLFILTGNEGGIRAGVYYFPERQNVTTIAKRIINGTTGIEPLVVTIPEGFNNEEVAKRIAYRFPRFDENEFLVKAQELEGYLFPDTYYFLPTVSAEEVIETMRDNFTEKTEGIKKEAEDAGFDFEEVVIMASLLEEESFNNEDRETIAGVLWNRININMPLQVDAVFVYLLGKNGFDITFDDLEVDSPYNTYKYNGFPPGAISNPGLDSLQASIYYDENPFLYYLSDRNGVTYFSETFEEHKIKKEKYLR